MATISENLQTIADSTSAIKQAIIDKGGDASGDITTWADAINNIPSGGGSVVVAPVSKSDVNFYDYDGTILHSYTKEQFLALSAMPELPTRNGLICQGWNYTFNDAKTYVDNYGMLNVGAMYITDDGDTRLYIRIASEGRMTVPLYWSQTVSRGVSIDWGDGSIIQSVSGTGNKNTTHTYAKPGDYVIRLKVANGCALELGQYNYSILGMTANENTDATIYAVYRNMLRHVEIGRNVINLRYAFSTCINLESITIPNNVTEKLNFRKNYSLKFITIPKSITSIPSYTFYCCYDLKSVIIPNSVTSIGNNAFYHCDSLTNIEIPNSVTSMDEAVFHSCNGLISFTCSDSISTINSQTFYYCSGMATYDFSKHTSVPTLENKDAFTFIQSGCQIRVPSSLLSAWKAATNWSTYAGYIVGV